jgi:hypothetical protein
VGGLLVLLACFVVFILVGMRGEVTFKSQTFWVIECWPCGFGCVCCDQLMCDDGDVFYVQKLATTGETVDRKPQHPRCYIFHIEIWHLLH